jgi:hypothetical protein
MVIASLTAAMVAVVVIVGEVVETARCSGSCSEFCLDD